jgi:single-strand DNA-binding protein
MNTVNRIFLLGRVGRKPEYRVYADGKDGLCKFSLATDRPGKDGKTDWHNVTCFGQTAIFARDFLDVGDLVHVEGRQENDKRTDGDEKGYWPGVVADRVTALPSAKRIEKELEITNPEPAKYNGPDLPF